MAEAKALALFRPDAMNGSMADGEESGETSGARFIAALARPDDPGHRAPDMLLYRLLKLAHLIQRPLARLGEAASHELCEWRRSIR